MRKLLGATLLLGIVVVLVVLVRYGVVPGTTRNAAPEGKGAAMTSDDAALPRSHDDGTLGVTAISHASMVLTWGGVTIFNDPVGGASAYAEWGEPDLVLVSHAHWDHFDVDTLKGVVGADTVLLVPQEVAAQLPEPLASRAIVMRNGETGEYAGVSVTAVPMYNLPQRAGAPHVKGDGNGYLLEKDGYRAYIAGDTSGIPEMRALTDVDTAFIPMDLPYTMRVEEAADAVLAFAPKRVYPYHYRTPDGFSDVAKFAEIVHGGNPEIEIVQLDWYAGSR